VLAPATFHCSHALSDADPFVLCEVIVMTSFSSLSPNLVPSMEEQSRLAISDDECMVRLARAVEQHDDRRLQEVAQLIGRLAVTIE
jgi:hypothetical protein